MNEYTLQSPSIILICAIAEHGVIGRDNRLLWKLPEDMKFFRESTLSHSVVMGRKTFESIGKALPKRRNIVLTRQSDYVASGCETASTIQETLNLLHQEKEIYIIGGAKIYQSFMPLAQTMLLTHLNHTWDGDAYFPAWSESDWELVHERPGMMNLHNPYFYTFREYRRR
jgi:dihydrofolate reductase